MRVLTVRQPWATAIIRMSKDVENRSSNIAGSYRGPIAIHAGLHEPGRLGARTEFPGVGEVERDRGGILLRSPRLAWPYRLPLGVIVGVADLTDVHTDESCARSWPTNDHADCDEWSLCSPWAMPDHHHLVLANPRPLRRPIPSTGRLGLWRPDDDLLTAITEQLRPGEDVAP